MASAGQSDIWALVTRGPARKSQWHLELVTPRALNDDEVLVTIIASGICLADLHMGDVDLEAEDATGHPGVWYPRVLGHEGSGYVDQIGSTVTHVKPSDPVILSFNSCGKCYNCEDSHPAYCTELFERNFMGEKSVYADSGAQDFNIGGSFFGQSSFARKAIVKARCVVSLADYNVTEGELRTLAPLGCGIQTGAGAFTNIADVQPHHEVAVIGVGGVGQSAVMAAAMRRCKTIIAVDRSSSRLELARSLGATHTINTSELTSDLTSEVKRLTGQRGVHVSLDTTGVRSLARQSWDFIRNHGKVLQVGLAKPEDTWDIPMADHMNSGKQIIGCVEGDAVPDKFIPEMLTWYRDGRFPVGKIVSFYPVEEHERAIGDMRKGTAIKPVLLWEPNTSGHR